MREPFPELSIFDSHTHAFPRDAIESPSDWALKHRENHWKALVAPEGGAVSLQGWVHREEFIEQMDREGIEGAVLLGWYWENPESCQIQNSEMARWIASSPSQFRAMASVHPRGPRPDDLVRWAVENDFSGFGELLPSLQGTTLRDRFWDDLANRSVEADLLFNFHVTEPVGRPHPGRIATPFEDLEYFVSRHPDLKIILSHWGGGLFLHELNPYIRKLFRNVYYDCSASPLLYDPQIFKNALQVLGPEKVLFGSDYPLRLYPRKDTNPGWIRFLQEIEGVSLERSDLSAIFSANAAKLFGFLNRPHP